MILWVRFSDRYRTGIDYWVLGHAHRSKGEHPYLLPTGIVGELTCEWTKLKLTQIVPYLWGSADNGASMAFRSVW